MLDGAGLTGTESVPATAASGPPSEERLGAGSEREGKHTSSNDAPLEAWTVAELKSLLHDHGISVSGICERQELVDEVEGILQGEREVAEATFEQRYRAEPPHAVVFLDVDGVLNTTSSRARQLDPRCVRRLGNLVRSCGAKIVLSTTWRQSSALKRALLRALAREGIHSHIVVGQTPQLSFKERAREVREWLSCHTELLAWVAIDDLNFAEEDPTYFEGHFVLTDERAGLTDAGVALATDLLKAQLQP